MICAVSNQNGKVGCWLTRGLSIWASSFIVTIANLKQWKRQCWSCTLKRSMGTYNLAAFLVVRNTSQELSWRNTWAKFIVWNHCDKIRIFRPRLCSSFLNCPNKPLCVWKRPPQGRRKKGPLSSKKPRPPYKQRLISVFFGMCCPVHINQSRGFFEISVRADPEKKSAICLTNDLNKTFYKYNNH